MKRFASAIIFSALLASVPVNAQELVHQPAEALNIPAAGEPLTLRVMLTKSKRIDLPVFAHIVRDGQVMQMPMVGKLDDFERAIYSATLPAPVADLAYQFLYLPDGEGTTPRVTPRYASRRSCRFPTTPVAGDAPDPTSPAGRADLTQRSQTLEGEVNVLGAVNDVVAKLREEVSVD